MLNKPKSLNRKKIGVGLTAGELESLVCKENRSIKMFKKAGRDFQVKGNVSI
jgi:hypothetical protein